MHRRDFAVVLTFNTTVRIPFVRVFTGKQRNASVHFTITFFIPFNHKNPVDLKSSDYITVRRRQIYDNLAAFFYLAQELIILVKG